MTAPSIVVVGVCGIATIILCTSLLVAISNLLEPKQALK
jgi:hypothetical protein